MKPMTVEEEVDVLRKAIVEVAKLHGIESPIQLIGAAQNNEETFADILLRLIKVKHEDEATALREAQEKIEILKSAIVDKPITEQEALTLKAKMELAEAQELLTEANDCLNWKNIQEFLTQKET